MKDNAASVLADFPEGSFQHLFWEQQLKASRVSCAKNMKWHPMMIRWCLNLKLLSTACYHALRTSGFLKLPSERTLRDYTHYVKSRSGFQDDIDDDLAQEAKIKELPEWKKYVVLLLDEMKIKESLVYDKIGAKVIGFVDLGSVNNQLLEFEQSCNNPPIATHMLVLMVRGIFIHLQYPYAHFPTTKLSGATLFPIIWEAVERLEFIGFKVIVITADGASPNRKFFSLHGGSYKTVNPYSDDERYIYFVSDPPHLIKTTRNCWSHSGEQGPRHLWVSYCSSCMYTVLLSDFVVKIDGKDIRWSHLLQLYEAQVGMISNSSGLALLPKLSIEHVQLTSFSRMRVDLAAQVYCRRVQISYHSLVLC